MSQWQMLGSAVGLNGDNLNQVFSGLAAAAGEAAADSDSQFAKTFKSLGVSVTDANGNLRSMSHILGDLAFQTKNLDPAKKLYGLNQIFGDDDFLIVADLFESMKLGCR